MLKIRKCPICKADAHATVEKYHSGIADRLGKSEIIVDDVAIYECSKDTCRHKWLPIDQEKKIDSFVAKNKRFDLRPEEIALIRESLPFNTKTATAEFLCFNEKAFTKWEIGYTEPNRAYDLLMRLAAFSKENVNFIKHLHSSSFKFNCNDYQLICEKLQIDWTFKALQLDSEGAYRNPSNRYTKTSEECPIVIENNGNISKGYVPNSTGSYGVMPMSKSADGDDVDSSQFPQEVLAA